MATSDCILLRTLTQDVEAHADNETLWRADGTSFLAECWAYPLRRDHTIVGAVITFVDITDRSRAQLALADSEQRYRALYENLPLATVTWQINGDDFLLINVNQMAEEESNTKADHLIGQHARVLYHDQPAMRDILRDTVQSRTRQQRDIQYISLLRHKLHSITCTCGFVPPDLVIMHIEDITKRRHAESKLRHYQRQLRALAAQITLVEERERRRVAADLHDHVCQTLAAIKLKLGVLAEAIAVKPVAADLHYTMAMLDQCIRATRDLSFDLSPPVLYELGLDAALEWLADHLHTKRLAIRVATNGQPAALTDDLRVLLFIVTREVVINAIKHAAAQTITITRTTAADQLRITVHDDGRGFAKGRSTTLRTRRGFGLFSIRERLRNVGGTIDIASAPDAGTTVEIMVPLSHDTERLGGSPAPAEDIP
jgi:signal transduction histidine kinase